MAMMSRSWVPFSAAALVTGAIALMLGALLMPMGEDTAAILEGIKENDQRWLTVAVMFGIASVGILMGLPAMVLLFPRRGHRVGMAGVAVMTMASAGLAGFGMILVFFQSLALRGALVPGRVEEATDSARFSVMLLGWAASFYVAELLLAIAVLRARSVPRWIPALLLLHVVSFGFQSVIPEDFPPLVIVFGAIGLSGLAVSANTEADRLSGLGR